MSQTEVITPARIAELVAPPGGRVDHPTAEQAAVIAAAPGAALVVAGAGSGKTTTMAQRAAWLVANGIARPEEILGLTFTRKAARELRSRIGIALDRLPAAPAPAQPVPIELPALVELPHRPLVATYNSFASAVYREHALVIGLDPDAAVLSDSAAWLLARRVVLASADPRLVGLDRSLTTIIDAVLSLSRALSDNAVAEAAEVESYARRYLETIEAIPLGPRAAQYAEQMSRMRAVDSLPILLPLVEAYGEAKRRQGVMEFSDQVVAALRIVEASPLARASLRAQHRFVILDEYQDTSVVQTRLLSTLFAERPDEPGRSIVAVGDPNQAIYEWRGASESNLADFAAEFGGPGGEAQTFSLMVSWRNPARVLAAGNAVATPLRTASLVPVGELEERPAAAAGRLDAIWAETIAEEAAAVAQWFAQRLRAGGEPPTAAILLRRRVHLPSFAAALRDAGVECRELGVGGLFQTPEVTDLVAALRVLVDPDAGSALIRLLAGPRWRLGVRDLAVLADTAARLHRHRGGAQQQEVRSIVDALDALVDIRDDWDGLEDFSAEGLARLREAGALLRRLRARVGIPLLELVRVVEEALGLDIEVAANDARRGGAADLRAFRAQVESFLTVDDTASLRGFLAWVDRVLESDERLGVAEEPAQPGIVQLLTVHAAKGLEWDLVALPRMVERDFPTDSREGAGWLGFGELPHEFRGDADTLRRTAWFDWSAPDRKVLKERFEAYRIALRARHELGERRLGYVAITRAKQELLLTGSHWPGTYDRSAKAHRPRLASPYVLELVGHGLLPEDAIGTSRHETDPTDPMRHVISWPGDPLGARRPRVEHAARLVAAADPDGDLGRWAADVELLLAERARHGAVVPAAPPARIPASGFKSWMADAVGTARRIARPMPQQPHRATRLGTLFHSWVEERYRRAAPEALFDLEDEAADLDPDDFGGLAPADEARLAELRERFERSDWAFRRPIAIEQAIELPFAGRTVPCKIDAVFAGDGVVEIVDWKTGRRPDDPEELRMFDYQLDLYRIAWAKRSGTPLDAIVARAYFVASDTTYTPSRARDEEELLAEWSAALARLTTD